LDWKIAFVQNVTIGILAKTAISKLPFNNKNNNKGCLKNVENLLENMLQFSQK
jgi:hypothetical protein